MLCTLENETSSAPTVAEVLDPNQHSLTTGKTVYKIKRFFCCKAFMFQEKAASEPISPQVLPVCEKIFHETRIGRTYKNSHWGETICLPKMQQELF